MACLCWRVNCDILPKDTSGTHTALTYFTVPTIVLMWFSSKLLATLRFTKTQMKAMKVRILFGRYRKIGKLVFERGSQ